MKKTSTGLLTIKWIIACGLKLLILTIPVTASAHPLAPSLLSIQWQHQNSYELRWITPLQRIDDVRLQPVIPDNCAKLEDYGHSVEGTAIVQRWHLQCEGSGLIGREIGVRGIVESGANVLLNLSLSGDKQYQQILTPSKPFFSVPSEPDSWGVFTRYLELGTEHLLFGLDHVLFVAALALLLGMRRSMIRAVTGFTVGYHLIIGGSRLR